nr:hypothetical protein CFP56_73566 [Quercus suber]
MCYRRSLSRPHLRRRTGLHPVSRCFQHDGYIVLVTASRAEGGCVRQLPATGSYSSQNMKFFYRKRTPRYSCSYSEYLIDFL